jgi:zinc protease
LKKRDITDPLALTARLNRGVRTARARVSFVAEVPFGSLAMRRYRLGNGLTILVLSDPSTPLLSYHTWYKVGSRHEQPGKTGLAHLFEHLMFNQTRSLPQGEFDRRIEAAGGETNASTWTDWTQYHTELPAGELPVIVALEAERMKALVLREPQLRSEKEVVINERRYRVEDDVEGTVSEKMYALAFRKHPYHHPTIGWMKDIEGFTTDDCREFYRTYYAPNNAILVVVGGVDEAQVLGLVQKHYGSVHSAEIPAPPAVVERPQQSERCLVLKRPTPTEKLALGYHAPAFGDPDYPALLLLNELLFVGGSARMFQLLVRKEQLATDVNGSIAPFVDPGLYDIWVSMRPGRHAREATRILDREFKKLRQQPVPAKDLERVKSRAELGFLLGLETAAGRAEQIGFYETVMGDAALLFDRLKRFREVTAKDVQRVAARVLDPARRTRIEVLPSGGAEA